MDLKDAVCHKCYFRDRKDRKPCLISAENNMEPGDVSDTLPELGQIEEIIIAGSHVQMVLFRYRGHQYHDSGHCVSFMQSIIKTIDVLSNLPLELDVILVRSSNTGQNSRLDSFYGPKQSVFTTLQI